MSARFAFALLVALAGAAAAQAGDYSDPSGYSLRYPDGWQLINKQNLGNLDATVPQETRDWVAKNGASFNSVALIILRSGRADFSENVNLVVTDGEIPLTDGSVREVSRRLKEALKVTDLNARVGTAGTRAAIIADYSVALPGMAIPLRQRQVSIPGGGKTYLFTCTALPDTFDANSAAFDAITGSFNGPAATSPAGGGQGIVAGALKTGGIGAVIGGTVGGLVWLIRKLTGGAAPPKRAKKRRRDAYEEDDE